MKSTTDYDFCGIPVDDGVRARGSCTEMTHTWNYRITFLREGDATPDVTVQNASSLESAIGMARRHVIGAGPAKILFTEIKHRTGWERC